MILQKKQSFYEKHIKTFLDVFSSLIVIVAFCWLFAIIALLVRIKLGKPIIYTANRIGKNGKQFKLFKFRSMTDARDENGNLLPDTVRLTKFGRILRSTSLDELPEMFNILKLEMSIIGPRPMPVSYREYFTKEEWRRHDTRPGLTGWAQIHGRNAISWEQKFKLDLWYVNNISLQVDSKIIIETVLKVLKRADIGQGEEAPESLNVERANWQKTNEGVISPLKSEKGEKT